MLLVVTSLRVPQSPFHNHIVVGTDAAIYLKQDLQDWYQGCE